MTETPQAAGHSLPPLCYVRHVTTGETVQIRRGKDGYHPVDTPCSPECLNSRLPRPPTESEVRAMRHGSIFGWDSPGTDPEKWERRERHW